MKKIITILALIVFSGCASNNAIWMPTSEEWQLMTPEQKLQWQMVQMAARQQRQQQLRQFLKDFDETLEEGQELRMPIFVPSRQSNFPSNYWQEELARQEYWDRLRQGY